ncbi:Uu.00g146740.m01.CDS01 [Anthostomella pinea]|uniref:Uu.00g146740.m01.CDS01 n=1 Tax=Anthostomella pinea TaxID=933095 RepID=A0AAI8YLV4_9PEZI|nr:Uu.00g146740.m01.CDS01 [Anthostomella pinea]
MGAATEASSRPVFGELDSNITHSGPAKDANEKVSTAQSNVITLAPATRPFSLLPRGKKRKAEEDPLSFLDISDEDPRLARVTDDCNALRRKVWDFLEAESKPVSYMSILLRVRYSALQRFLSQWGSNEGLFNRVREKAFRFFKKRELAGSPMPINSVDKDKEAALLDVSGVEIAKGFRRKIEVYDTCDDVRSKLISYLTKPHVSREGLIQSLNEHGCLPGKERVTLETFIRFLCKHGPTEGNRSAVFYAGYVFFEKMRIRDGKEKSRFRLKMEEAWPRGVDLNMKGFRNERHYDHDLPEIGQDEFGRVTTYWRFGGGIMTAENIDGIRVTGRIADDEEFCWESGDDDYPLYRKTMDWKEADERAGQWLDYGNEIDWMLSRNIREAEAGAGEECSDDGDSVDDGQTEKDATESPAELGTQ